MALRDENVIDVGHLNQWLSLKTITFPTREVVGKAALFAAIKIETKVHFYSDCQSSTHGILILRANASILFWLFLSLFVRNRQSACGLRTVPSSMRETQAAAGLMNWTGDRTFALDEEDDVLELAVPITGATTGNLGTSVAAELIDVKQKHCHAKWHGSGTPSSGCTSTDAAIVFLRVGSTA